MKNIEGLIIKRKREEMGYKQDYICKGICAVSYLSKIEKGIITPSDEIIQQLMERLGISYCNESNFVERGKELFEECYLAGLYGYSIKDEVWEQLETDKEKYLNSPLHIDYQICMTNKYFRDLDSVSILELKDFMDNKQLYRAYLITGLIKEDIILLEKANHIERAPEVLNGMGLIKWKNGKYYEAIELFLEAQELAEHNNYLGLIMDNNMLLGHIYMEVHRPTMDKYYNKALVISKLLGAKMVEAMIYYHIGVAYTAVDFYKAEKNLLLCVELCPKEEIDTVEKAFQKLCFLYLKYDIREKVDNYYQEVLKYNNFKEINELIKIMLDNADYIHNKEYINKLTNIYKHSKKDEKHSNTEYYGQMLLVAFKSNRRYKEALEVTEYMHSNIYQ